MSLHLFAIVQGFFAMFALALAGMVLFAAASMVHAAAAWIARQRRPATAKPRPQLRLVPSEPRPEPAPQEEEQDDGDSEWLKEFG